MKQIVLSNQAKFYPLSNVGIGHNRPPLDHNRAPQPEVQPVRVVDPAWGDSIHDYPHKYAASIRENEKLYACCREVDDLKCAIFKSPTCGVYPYDIFVAICGCGRRHTRMIVGDRYTFVKRR